MELGAGQVLSLPKPHSSVSLRREIDVIWAEKVKACAILKAPRDANPTSAVEKYIWHRIIIMRAPYGQYFQAAVLNSTASAHIVVH